ncbi:MAG: hypothetical protein B6I37_06990 [Desulfobacteraceae bacterium 4572_35.2]|nr:MAG: hypothetical protein B6I37_06990 [Desulfobacteraceae bacterium 4572_35.2]
MIHSDLFVVIHDAESDQWLKFETPVQIVIATTVEQVLEKLHLVETLVNNDGLYAAGYVGYQASPAFDSRLVTRSGGELIILILLSVQLMLMSMRGRSFYRCSMLSRAGMGLLLISAVLQDSPHEGDGTAR